ncbi:hypothetical protein MHK_008653 [Candidatus Magnetomorum sp. HK-1]|nr:hypothetical protein MHK_008653 [Candidatus Magnetomorum sp. HK-1]
MTNDFLVMVLTVFKDNSYFSLLIVVFFAILFIIKNSNFDFTITYRPNQKN